MIDKYNLFIIRYLPENSFDMIEKRKFERTKKKRCEVEEERRNEKRKFDKTKKKR